MHTITFFKFFDICETFWVLRENIIKSLKKNYSLHNNIYILCLLINYEK